MSSYKGNKKNNSINFLDIIVVYNNEGEIETN